MPRDAGHPFVIASQRVRPEVAGPMTSSAKQSRFGRAEFWIASSPPSGLLAMTLLSQDSASRHHLMTSKNPILIIGGGIGGLTTALALLQRGLDVTVYEQ